jgi:hypothetical protein
MQAAQRKPTFNAKDIRRRHLLQNPGKSNLGVGEREFI